MSDRQPNTMADTFTPPTPTELVLPEAPRGKLARPRGLPIAPLAEPARRRLPLAGPSREVDRQSRPVYAVWEITLRCDLACHHCGSRAGRARPDELSTAEALDVVRQMHDLGVLEVTLIGGEAYLRDDWAELARAVRAAGMSCSMTTGGRGITPERARVAKEAGLQAVSVSVDGTEATHDMLRGVTGSRAAAMAAIGHLREAGLSVSTNTQIGRLNFRELDAVFDDVVAAGVSSWQVQLTAAMGRAADTPGILLEPYQLLELMPTLARLKGRADAAGVRMYPGNNIGYFGPYEQVLRGTLPHGHASSCGAGRLVLGIEANGDIKGCPSLPSSDYVGGNLRDHSLREIWEQSAPVRFTRDRTVDELWGYCRSCYYADECRAGCSWTSHVLFGRRGNNPLCHHRALEKLREGKRERLEHVRPADGKPFDFARFEIVEEPFPPDELAAARVAAGLG